MSAAKQAIVGPGRFQWNPGGWWGASLGATAWMLVTAGFLVAHDQAGLSPVPIACFLLTNLVAGFLWVRRERLFPFQGLLILLSVLAVAVPCGVDRGRRLGLAGGLAEYELALLRICFRAGVFAGARNHDLVCPTGISGHTIHSRPIP